MANIFGKDLNCVYMDVPEEKNITFKTIVDPSLVEIEFQVQTFLEALASLEPTLLSHSVSKKFQASAPSRLASFPLQPL